MRLTQLIKSYPNYTLYPELNNFEVEGITNYSKEVLDNFIFVAIKGNQKDGNTFIHEAIEKGARAVVVNSLDSMVNTSEKVSFIVVDDTRKALADLSAEFYGHPTEKLRAVGITGTNGKTTISYLIEFLLKESGRTPGVLGTINYRFRNTVIPSKNTTPGPKELQSIFSDMFNDGVDYVVMEVSSHALDQDRTRGIKFCSAVFTNLTQDHLDYHITLENYFLSKAKLFKELSPVSFAVINTDDAHGRRLKELTACRIITYGTENAADVMAKDIHFNISRTEFVVKALDKEIKLKTKLIGFHNVYNILAAVSWGIKEGLDLSVMQGAIEKFNFVPGRLEQLYCNGDFSVFVDYAHTEDALANVVRTLRRVSNNRVIVVFGCGGERDKTKRPKMGRVVSELSDYAIITNDNPRSENPKDIINDIKSGITYGNYCVIPDRMEAIKKSLSMAKKGDVVLIAGKGHEEYQIVKGRALRFDDRQAVKACLKVI